MGEWKGEVWGMWAKSVICSAKKLETTWRSKKGPSGEIVKGKKIQKVSFLDFFLVDVLHLKMAF